MDEWWTYSLSDLLLFSPSTYYRLIELYNAQLWPLHLGALLLGGVCILLILGKTKIPAGMAIPLIFAALWGWIATAFLWSRFATINWAASYYAGLFVAQAGLLLIAAFSGKRLTFHARDNKFSRISGLILFSFALLLQPLSAPLSGRSWGTLEIFALSPDPTVTATLAIILTADRTSWGLMIIPFLWCILSGATLWTMGSPDFWLLPTIALLIFSLSLWKSHLQRSGQANP